MSRDMVERYRRWYDYERDAHAKVIRSLESVPIDRQGSPEFKRALAIFAHVAAARRLWLGRLGILPPLQASLFPEGADIDKIARELQETESQWVRYLDRLTDDDIARTFEYQSLDAGRFRNRVEDILTQLFGHSWYHRGQIAMLVRAAGGEPAATDLVFWCREALPVSTS